MSSSLSMMSIILAMVIMAIWSPTMMAFPSSCSHTTAAGTRYDMSALDHLGDFELISGSFIYWLNPCALNVAVNCYNLGTNICQKNPDDYVSLGALQTNTTVDSLDCDTCGFRMQVTGGTAGGCSSGRTAEVRYICSKEEGLQSVDEPTRCNYLFTFRSPLACPIALPQCDSLSINNCSSQSNCKWCDTTEGCIPLGDSCFGQCTYSSANGYTYNLTALTYFNGTDNYISADSDTSSGHKYYFNPCGYTKQPCDSATPLCLQSLPAGSLGHSTGDLSTSQLSQSPICEACGTVLSYTRGTSCNDGYRSSQISFICSSVEQGITYAHTDAFNEPCVTYLTFRSPVACPTKVALCTTLDATQCSNRTDCQYCHSSCIPISDTCRVFAYDQCAYNTTSGGFQYNVTSLIRYAPLSDWSVRSGTYEYRFSPCSTTMIGCNIPGEETPVCELGTIPVTERSLGKLATGIASSLPSDTYCDGCGFRVTYTGGDQEPGCSRPRSVEVRYVCSDTIDLDVAEPATCVYVYTIRHPAACPINLPSCSSYTTAESCLAASSQCHYCGMTSGCLPRSDTCVFGCGMVSRNGLEYDLRGVSHANNVGIDDWYIASQIGTPTEYYLNPCNYTTFTCVTPTPGCQVQSKLTYAIGDLKAVAVDQSPRCEACGVQLSYLNGGSCGFTQRSMVIDFQCSLWDQGPISESEAPTCQYNFVWRTPYACAVNQPLCSSLSIGSCSNRTDCSWCSGDPNMCMPIGDAPSCLFRPVCSLNVTTTSSSSSLSSSSVGVYQYDLSSLRRSATTNFYYVTAEGLLTANPCNISAAGCRSDAAVCLGSRTLGSVRAASVLASPICDACGVQLVYQAGDICGTTNTSVIINAICSDLELGITNVTHSSACAYTIELHSRLACPLNLARCSDLSVTRTIINTTITECGARSDCITCNDRCAIAADGCQSCRYTNINGTVFDITNITTSYAYGMTYTSDESGAVYSYSPCGYTPSTLTGACGPMPSSLCRTLTNYTTSLANPIKTVWKSGTCERCGMIASYSGGAASRNSITPLSSTADVTYMCSDYHYGITSIRERSWNYYQLTVRSPAACAVNRPACSAATTSSACDTRSECQWCTTYVGGGLCKPSGEFCNGAMGNCQFAHPDNGHIFDFSSLQSLSTDITATGDDYNEAWLYWFSICAPVTSTSGQQCHSQGILSAACRRAVDFSPTYESIGDFSSGVFSALPDDMPYTGLTLTYSGGATCSDNPLLTRITNLYIICDASATVPRVSGAVRVTGPVASDYHCTYMITVRTSSACYPESASGISTGGAIALITIGSCIGAYFVLGCLCNAARGRRGSRLCPNYECWQCACGRCCGACAVLRYGRTGHMPLGDQRVDPLDRSAVLLPGGEVGRAAGGGAAAGDIDAADKPGRYT